MKIRPVRKYMAVLVLMLLGAGFRLISLPREALEPDELYSRQVVLKSLPDAYVSVRNDLVHPPLYYLLLKTATSIWGTNPYGLRAFSLLCGIASIGLIAIVGERLPGAAWCGLLAATLLAVNRIQVFYSQEARSYAFYSMLVILLASWVVAISERESDMKLWIAGAVLMILLVYTHYFGCFYVLGSVVALMVSNVQRRTKLLAFAAGTAAALLLTPWLYAIASVYKSKQGLTSNLSWMQRPDLQDLRKLFAASLGVGNFRGGATLAFLIVMGLASVALFRASKAHALRQNPAVIAIALMSVLPPCIVFLLSNPPFNLPLFLLRHFLPSLTLLMLLSCYGLELLNQSLGRQFRPISVCGAMLMLAIGALPSLLGPSRGPLRFPFYAVVPRVESSDRSGTQAFAASFYMEGEPVNVYCGRTCVEPLPAPAARLPQHLLLLYLPDFPSDAESYRRLIEEGYADVGHMSYAGTDFAKMEMVVANLELRR